MSRSTALTLFLLSLPLYISSASSLEVRNDVNLTAAAALPACVKTCSEPIFESYSCQPQDSCFCTDNDLSTALQLCITSKCPSVADQLTAKKFQADTCELPIRSDAQTTKNTLWALFTLAWLFIIMRCLSRCKQIGGAGYWWDDWSLLMCCVPMVGVTITAYIGLLQGIGRDIWEVGVEGAAQSMKSFYAGETLYLAAVLGTKVSFVLLFIRIWKDQRTFRMACWTLIGVLCVTLFVFEFATIFQCTPVSYSWTVLTGGTGKCTNKLAQVYASAAINIVLDIIVLVLPIPNILKLDINNTKKAGVCVVFLVGIVVTICSCVRLRYLARFGESTEYNLTWDYNYVSLWSIIEVFLSIICVCIPAAAGCSHKLFTFVRDERNSRHVEEGDEKNLTSGPHRTLRASAIVNGLNIADVETGTKTSQGAESTTSGSEPRMSDSSDNMEQVVDSLKFRDMTIPTVEEQRRAAAKKAVAQFMADLENKHPSRSNLSTPPRTRAGPSEEKWYPPESRVNESPEEVASPVPRERPSEMSMLPCDPASVRSSDPSSGPERASASSGDVLGSHESKRISRPGMDSRRLSERSSAAESAAGSVHAFFDNVADPFFTDISPEEAKHRDDVKDTERWRHLPSAIPLRSPSPPKDRDAGKNSTRASSCTSAGDRIDKREYDVWAPRRAVSVSRRAVSRGRSLPRESKKRPSDSSEEAIRPSFPSHGVSLSYEGEQRVSDGTTNTEESEHSHRHQGVSIYEPPRYRNSDGTSSTSTAHDEHPLRSQGMSRPYSRSRSLQPYQRPPSAADLAAQYAASMESIPRFTSSDEDDSPEPPPIRFSGRMHSYQSSISNYNYPARPAASIPPTPYSHNQSSAASQYAYQDFTSNHYLPTTTYEPNWNQTLPASTDDDSNYPTTYDESNYQPSTTYDESNYNSGPSYPYMSNQDMPRSRPQYSVEKVADYASSMNSFAQKDVHISDIDDSSDDDDESTVRSPPSHVSIATRTEQEDEERHRRRVAAEAVFNIIAESRAAQEKISPNASTSSVTSSERRQSLGDTIGRAQTYSANYMPGFHERSRMFDEEMNKQKKAIKRAASFGMTVKTDKSKYAGSTFSGSSGQSTISPGSVISPGEPSPPSVSRLRYRDMDGAAKELVVGRELVDLCVSD